VFNYLRRVDRLLLFDRLLLVVITVNPWLLFNFRARVGGCNILIGSFGIQLAFFILDELSIYFLSHIKGILLFLLFFIDYVVRNIAIITMRSSTIR